MKLLNYSLVFVCGAAVASLLTYQWLERAKAEAPAAEMRETVRVERVVVSDPAVVAELARVVKENAEMRTALDEVQTRLLDNDALLKHTEAKLDELRRPMTADIMSSSLRAEMKSGEAIVTGGYRVAGGKRLYAFATPVVERSADGAEQVKIEFQTFRITDEVSEAVGLDTISTNASNTLQHGEVWIAEEYAAVVEKLKTMPGMEGATLSPELAVKLGDSGVFNTEELQLKVTPERAESGDGLNVELRLEQPAVAVTSESPKEPQAEPVTSQ